MCSFNNIILLLCTYHSHAPPPPYWALEGIRVLIPCPLGIFGGLIPRVILDFAKLSQCSCMLVAWPSCFDAYIFDLLLYTIRKCNTYSTCMLTSTQTYVCTTRSNAHTVGHSIDLAPIYVSVPSRGQVGHDFDRCITITLKIRSLT